MNTPLFGYNERSRTSASNTDPAPNVRPSLERQNAMAKFRPIPPLTPKQIDRFWSRVDVPYQPSCCWEWQGYKHRDGYGCVRYERKMGAFQAHRVSYTLLLGPIPDGM